MGNKVGEETRRRRWIAWAIALAAIAAALWWQKPWADSVMTVTVTVSTDEQPAAGVYRKRAFFSASRSSRPVMGMSVDLRRWEGELVRLDVRGTVRPRAFDEGSTGYFTCSAHLNDADGTGPLEFIGWQEGGSIWLHVGRLGCPSFVANAETDPPFVYTKDNWLWHVLRVPERGRVRLSLSPLLADDLQGRPAPFVPAARPPEQEAGRREIAGAERRPDVFIYVIDALRADHLGCYGYPRRTSAAIDAFAARATLYERAYTPTTWTRSSVATMLTGIYPCVHGAMHLSDVLDEWLLLLPEVLQQTGYTTCCVTTNGNVAEPFGFDQGYDSFVFGNRHPAEWVNWEVGRFLRGADDSQPVFMYLHTVEPHDPYTPGPESFARFDRGLNGVCDGTLESIEAVGRLRPDLTAEDVGHLIDLYDAEICEADWAFASFLDVLRRHERLGDALVILLADHGESFDEHDTLGHGRNLNREEMQVPLIIKFPDGRLAGTRVSRSVSLVDLFPTVLGELGLDVELTYPLPGGDLFLGASDPGSEPPRRLHAEVSQFDHNALDLVGIVDEDGYKRVIDVSVNPGAATELSLGLWDTGADPFEETDLVEARPVRAAYDEQLIAAWLIAKRHGRDAMATEGPPTVEMTDELRDQLRALGYLR